MSPQQEKAVGAAEHKKIAAQYGLYEDEALNAYVNEVGQRVAQKTERSDVAYKFYIIDSPIVNAFALPGGYVYVSRGLLALAENEAQLAAVLGHEIGHITARHSAERYSHTVLASLGTGLLSATIGEDGVSDLLGLGSNLYLSSYSRGQENQADTLGIRYLDHAGYNPGAMTEFLTNLQNHSALEAQIAGQQAQGSGYFSTHPATQDRISKTVQEAKQYPPHDTFFEDRYLNHIDDMIYGDSPTQGFVRDQSFIHPKIGFTFDVPDGYRIINRPQQVIATSQDGSLLVFDFVDNPQQQDVLSYLQQNWMKGEALNKPERIEVNGMQAATGAFAGTVNGQPTAIRLVAIQWSPTKVVRFQIGIPRGISEAQIRGIKTATYSFRKLNPIEVIKYKPHRVKIITARAGDTVSSLAGRMPFKDGYNDDRFRILNGMKLDAQIEAGGRYKTIAN